MRDVLNAWSIKASQQNLRYLRLEQVSSGRKHKNTMTGEYWVMVYLDHNKRKWNNRDKVNDVNLQALSIPISPISSNSWNTKVDLLKTSKRKWNTIQEFSAPLFEYVMPRAVKLIKHVTWRHDTRAPIRAAQHCWWTNRSTQNSHMTWVSHYWSSRDLILIIFQNCHIHCHWIKRQHELPYARSGNLYYF